MSDELRIERGIEFGRAVAQLRAAAWHSRQRLPDRAGPGQRRLRRHLSRARSVAAALRHQGVLPAAVRHAPAHDRAPDHASRTRRCSRNAASASCARRRRWSMLGRVAGASDGIVRVQTYFEALGTCFLVMDYVEGEQPRERVPRRAGRASASARAVAADAVAVEHPRRASGRAGAPRHQAGQRHPARGRSAGADRFRLRRGRRCPARPRAIPRSIPAATDRPSRCLVCARASSPTSTRSGRCATGRSAAAWWTRWRGRIRWRPGRSDPQPSAVAIGAGRYPQTLLAAIDAALAVDPAQRPQSCRCDACIARPRSSRSTCRAHARAGSDRARGRAP